MMLGKGRGGDLHMDGDREMVQLNTSRRRKGKFKVMSQFPREGDNYSFVSKSHLSHQSRGL